jgi:hypothetical protein
MKPAPPASQNFNAWAKLFPLAVFAVYFYLFLEWLFFVTKPSFMDYLNLGEKLGIWLLPGLIIAGSCLLVLLVFFALGWLLRRTRFHAIFIWLGAIFPSVFFAFTGLMFVDNFTYTVLRFGIIHTQGIQRGLYALAFLIFFAWLYRQVILSLGSRPPAPRLDRQDTLRLIAAALILCISIPFAGNLFATRKPGQSALTPGQPTHRPNILLIGSDGLDATDMSIDGNLPDTTPFLRSFAQNALLSLNNFPNANFTSGSLVSMFTSKLPTQTRMLYPPDILKGSDAFEHLPGMLKKFGYYNAEVSVDYYGDSSVFNLQDSFVMMNGRSDTIGRLYTFSRSYLPEDAAYFLSMISKRLSDRIFHIFYLRSMPNPYAEVRQKLNNMSDEDRVGQIISLFSDINQPLFIHAHLMGTHTNETQIYHQGIREFDDNMHHLVDELGQMGRLENTLIVVYTDHGFGNVSHVRLPLLFHFPNAAYTGTLSSNTQNMDIAPTILTYLGVQPPQWMNGQSLIDAQLPANRPIFSAAPNFRADEDNLMQLDLTKINPPYYQFGSIEMVVCQNWYELNTTNFTWQQGEVEDYSSACPPTDLPTLSAAQQMILARLKQDGFDTASLEKTLH